MAAHTVQQGEHLSGIAKQYGFYNYRTIWNDPSNDDLRKLRSNPHVLAPGDVVNIPDKQSKTVARRTDDTHSFQVAQRPLKLAVKMQRYLGTAHAGAPCDTSLDQTGSTTTDSDGGLSSPIDKQLKSGALNRHETVSTGQAQTAVEHKHDLNIGHLDPVDVASGQVSRLINLGYYHGAADPVDAYQLRSAVEEFQCDNGLTSSGTCDGDTQAKLLVVHGC